MQLHAKNLAVASGVPKDLVEEAVRFMRSRGKYKKETAEEFLKAYDMYRNVRLSYQLDQMTPVLQTVLSTFSGEFHRIR
jgi:hydroxymethylglutaryl-CoA synthase